MVTKEMIGAAHDICLKKGDFVLSANLLERIYLAMRDKAEGNDSAGWDAYEDLRKASDETFLELRQRVQELTAERDRLSELCDKWNFECDEMREDNERLANVANALKQQIDELVAALILASCCLEPNTSSATVNQIEAAIASVKEK